MVLSDLLTPNEILRGSRAEYKILGIVGRGGMGAVYRVQRLADNTIWALKEMHPPPDTPASETEENRRLFIQEADLLRSLDHANLPAVADFFDHERRPVLVMEFVAGQTLESRIREANAPLLEQQVLGYGIQLARVLSYLHTRQPPVIYRDLKPSNIILTPEGVLKLIDFGVARTYKARKSKDTIAMGSAGYAPPEQYGKGQTDARSDVYALGATLLHLLMNMPPIPLQTPATGSIRKMNPSVDEQTEQVIMKSMALDPNARYPDMASFEKALRQRLDAPYVDPITRATPPPPIIPATTAASVPSSIPVPTIQPQRAPSPTQVPVPPVEVPAGSVPCPTCGRLNKTGAKFCAGCGTPLKAPSAAHLSITSPRGSWQYKIEKTQLRIGRRDPRQNHYPEIDLAEHDRGVASRNHAIISRDGDYYTITDLGSTNGTRVNGQLVPRQQARQLRSGDRIKVGEVELEFLWN
ncbi:MAG: FHA domain-containing protein [Chloroflexi bacterium AL-W]|nr:FHA domain-containing protein [Chloroflexi bacterium AL-N1]NOK68965.1 FHA domain-containing protein [Chloroflexi bacterium AL-N10]NOK76948.1 FHA domain-containing protein [Chloroflexi bacterium AL-N5]NOK82664.1 FHA domain-containing protein [Chloroflexi bacterium AL-W]NOK90805.1 FHA domain-containing protein [Chloroflexi bacterium AL-N15]